MPDRRCADHGHQAMELLTKIRRVSTLRNKMIPPETPDRRGMGPVSFANTSTGPAPSSCNRKSGPPGVKLHVLARIFSGGRSALSSKAVGTAGKTNWTEEWAYMQEIRRCDRFWRCFTMASTAICAADHKVGRFSRGLILLCSRESAKPITSSDLLVGDGTAVAGLRITSTQDIGIEGEISGNGVTTNVL